MCESAPEHAIALRGSTEVVIEFFSYGVNTLLFQRGVYPPESFARVAKYGLTMLVCTDEGVRAYMQPVLAQMRDWLARRALRRVVVVLASVATRKVLERWAFDVRLEDEECAGGGGGGGKGGDKEEKVVIAEIQAVVRQITASVTFLPLLDEAVAFDILIYTDEGVATPGSWEESGPRVIKGGEHVTLRSFSTAVHNVEASVSYARDDTA